MRVVIAIWNIRSNGCRFSSRMFILFSTMQKLKLFINIDSKGWMVFAVYLLFSITLITPKYGNILSVFPSSFLQDFFSTFCTIIWLRVKCSFQLHQLRCSIPHPYSGYQWYLECHRIASDL